MGTRLVRDAERAPYALAQIQDITRGVGREELERLTQNESILPEVRGRGNLGLDRRGASRSPIRRERGWCLSPGTYRTQDTTLRTTEAGWHAAPRGVPDLRCVRGRSGAAGRTSVLA